MKKSPTTIAMTLAALIGGSVLLPQTASAHEQRRDYHAERDHHRQSHQDKHRHHQRHEVRDWYLMRHRAYRPYGYHTPRVEQRDYRHDHRSPLEVELHYHITL